MFGNISEGMGMRGVEGGWGIWGKSRIERVLNEKLAVGVDMVVLRSLGVDMVRESVCASLVISRSFLQGIANGETSILDAGISRDTVVI